MEHINDFKLQQIGDAYYLFVPEYNISDFDSVKGIMKNILGRYKKYKGKSCFVFKTTPEPYLALIAQGEYPNIKKQHQFYETSNATWFQIFDALSAYFTPYIKILEPSAGKGSMITALAEWHLSNWGYNQFGTYHIHMIEQYQPNRFFLEKLAHKWQKSGHAIALVPDHDFLKTDLRNQYDLILANPPFNKGQAEAHLMKMIEHLKDKGALAVVLPETLKKLEVFTRYQTKQIDLPRDAFKHTGTMVKCFVAILSKQQFRPITEVVKPLLKANDGNEAGAFLIELDEAGNRLAFPEITQEQLDAAGFYVSQSQP